jgi:hypothetical protein
VVQTGTDSACTRVRPDDGGEGDDADYATAFSGGRSIIGRKLDCTFLNTSIERSDVVNKSSWPQERKAR